MRAYRIKNTKNGLYLKDDSYELNWVKFPHLVIYHEAWINDFLRKLGVFHDWIEYEEFPDYIEVETFEMSPVETFNYRTTLLYLDQSSETKYNTRLRTLKRLQKTAEESLNICEA